jgi:hypothetical protein
MPRASVGTPPPRGILELDRFSTDDLERWGSVSKDLDELNDVMHFNLEPERRRHRGELLAALRAIEPVSQDLQGWVRMVSYKYSLSPLSAAGSLTEVGGRFNAGMDLDPSAIQPWPALYVAQDQETAYREKYQLAKGTTIDGLTPEELSLHEGSSYSAVLLKGQLSRTFDITRHENLQALVDVFKKIKFPERAKALKKRLKIPENGLTMVKSSKQLYDVTVAQNWRILPVQFGLPAPSHVLAEMIRAAGFEAIIYPSSKGGRNCAAIFPDALAPGSFVELLDASPPGIIHARLDIETAEDLEGWEDVGCKRPRRVQDAS